MDLEECKSRVANIRKIAGDDEAAHCSEDGLYFDFIKYVAESADEELAAMAKEILKTEDIDFARWYA
jgi:hypothetical protein